MRDHRALIRSLRQTLETARHVFGSTSHTDIAMIVLLVVATMLASILVLTPGDQAGQGMLAFYNWFLSGR